MSTAIVILTFSSWIGWVVVGLVWTAFRVGVVVGPAARGREGRGRESWSDAERWTNAHRRSISSC